MRNFKKGNVVSVKFLLTVWFTEYCDKKKLWIVDNGINEGANDNGQLLVRRANGTAQWRETFRLFGDINQAIENANAQNDRQRRENKRLDKQRQISMF
jgi:hypothetical protein